MEGLTTTTRPGFGKFRRPGRWGGTSGREEVASALPHLPAVSGSSVAVA